MMFNKKLISAAVLSAVGAGAAQATYLSEDGTGQVLLYPYFTTRGGTDTLITVVNSTNRAKALKVRFLEGMNSKEVLDFNLYLSKHDVWTAAVTVDASGNPVLTVADKSCTAPMRVSGINGVHSEPFRNVLFTETGKVGAATVTAPSGIDRAKEGYLEIIEMGDITPSATPGTALNKSTAAGTIQFEDAVTHVSGVPADCKAVENAWGGVLPIFPAVTDFDTNIGGLFGSGTLINVNAGTDYSYDPVALKAFAVGPLAHSVPGFLTPSLSDGVTLSTVLTGAGVVQNNNWTKANAAAIGAGLASKSGAAAVSAVLTRQDVLNEYIVDPGLAAGTDWVVNFPTRRFHIGDLPPTNKYDYRPFRKSFLEDVSGVCEPVAWSVWGQEEETSSSPIDVSPQGPGATYQLCWEVNVVTFKGSNVLGSTNKYDLTPNWNAGWADLNFSLAAAAGTYTPVEPFDTEHYMIADEGDVYNGLPTIGLAVQRYTNGNVGGVLSNYGGSFIHKYVNAF
jgi:hypothetical protein